MQIVNVKEIEGTMMVALPVEIVDELRLSKGSPVNLTVEEGPVVLRTPGPRYPLAQRIADSDPRAFERTKEDEEWFDSPPVGAELI